MKLLSGEENGWWKITKIASRAGANVPLPGPSCYAYEGMNNGYIKDITPGTPPPSTNEYILHVKDGVTRKFIEET